MYLSYFGIRATDFEKSLKFYTEILGLRQVKQGENTRNGGGRYVLPKDPKSGQKPCGGRRILRRDLGSESLDGLRGLRILVEY